MFLANEKAAFLCNWRSGKKRLNIGRDFKGREGMEEAPGGSVGALGGRGTGSGEGNKCKRWRKRLDVGLCSNKDSGVVGATLQTCSVHTQAHRAT